MSWKDIKWNPFRNRAKLGSRENPSPYHMNPDRVPPQSIYPPSLGQYLNKHDKQSENERIPLYVIVLILISLTLMLWAWNSWYALPPGLVDPM